MRIAFSVVAMMILAPGAFTSPAQAERTGDPTRVSFDLELSRVTSNLSILSTTAMPGATLRLKVPANASADRGLLRQDGQDWLWDAPESPGLARLEFTKGQETMRLNVFVLTPWVNGEDEAIDGFKVGAYSKNPFRGLSTYRAPTGFIEVTDETRDLKISPHFTLGQFLCKQQPSHDPTFVLIRASMLVKLEALLEAVNDAGFHVDTLTVMSGFRTPWYNASIGNRTTSSRHLFGGAADVFVDIDGDGNMDDLNGDGVVNKSDASVLAALAEDLARSSEQSDWPSGGIAAYAANAAHGPFVHIDARGYRARW